MFEDKPFSRWLVRLHRQLDLSDRSAHWFWGGVVFIWSLVKKSNFFRLQDVTLSMVTSFTPLKSGKNKSTGYLPHQDYECMILSTTVFPEKHLQTTVFNVSFEMRLVEGCEIIRTLCLSDQRGAQTKATMQIWCTWVHETGLFHLDQEPPLWKPGRV